MDKPTLTPHVDALERILPEFIAQIRRDAQCVENDRVVAQMTEVIVPAIMRAVAMQRDLRTSSADILRGFDGAIANAVMSGICTLTNMQSALCPAAMWNVAVAMQRIDAAISARFGDPAMEKAVFGYGYDDPDIRPGRA